MKTLITIALLALTIPVMAAETQTRTLPDGSTQVIIPVTEQKCKLQNQSNLGNAAIGAGVGYAAGKVAGGSRRGSTWGLVGLAAGALIGANTQKTQTCRYEDVLVGHKVITIKNGKSTETFVPYKGA